MDKKMMKKMMGKPEDESDKSDAKLNALKELKKAASDMMGDGLSAGMKKVTVAAKDTPGLEEGLEKAKEMLAMHKGDKEEMPEEESEDEMGDYGDIKEEDCDTPEEIDARIKELLEKKKQLLAERG